MGKQARLRAERREARARPDRATDLLRELFHKIRCLTYESPRRCWEMMLEIMGELAGVNCLEGGCLSSAARVVLRDVPDAESLLTEFIVTWTEELDRCQSAGAPITDPIGTILEENDGTNAGVGQFFTPPSLVRLMNKVTFMDADDRRHKALDPCCGTGRFALDAVVHYPNIIMHSIDVDLWMMRAALINFRYAQKYSMARLVAPLDGGRVFDQESADELRARGIPIQKSENEGDLILLGGRSWIIHADALIVDVDDPSTWQYSWSWNPPPWQSTLKIKGFDGTYEDWRARNFAKELPSQKNATELKPRIDFELDDAELRHHMVRAAKRSGWHR